MSERDRRTESPARHEKEWHHSQKGRERTELGGKKRYTVGMMTESVGRGEEGRWKEGSVMSPHIRFYTPELLYTVKGRSDVGESHRVPLIEQINTFDVEILIKGEGK